MSLGDISVNLTINDKDFKVGINNAKTLLRELGGNFEGATRAAGTFDNRFSSAATSFRHFVQMAGMVKFLLMDIQDTFLSMPVSIAKTSGEIERMTKLLEGLSTASDKHADAMKNRSFVFDMAQSSPFDVHALTDTFIKLKTGGLDPTTGSMKALVNATAQFGGNSETLKRASIAIQQMAGKGVVSMEELRQQLGEAVPTAMRSMAEGFNMSMAELNKAVSKGTVSAVEGFRAMFTVMSIESEFAADKMMDTWVGLEARLNTKWELFKNKAGESGFMDEAKKSVKELIDAFDSDTAVQFANSLGNGLRITTNAITGIVKLLADMSGLIKLAGEAWLLYFAATKVNGLYDALTKVSGKLRSFYSEGAQRSQAPFDSQRKFALEELEAQRRAVQERIELNNKALGEELKVERAAAEEKKRLLNEQVTANKAAIEKMAADTKALAEQQKYQQQAAMSATYDSRTMMRDAYLGNAGSKNYQAIKERAAAMRAEAAATRTSIVEIEAQSAALAAETAALERNLVALNQQTAGETALGSAIRSEIKDLEAKKAELAAVTLTTETATTASRVFAGALGVVRGMLSMFGWTALITALTYVVDKLTSIMNRAERIKQIHDGLEISSTARRDAYDNLEKNRSDVRADELNLNDLKRVKNPHMSAADKANYDKAVAQAEARLKESRKRLLESAQDYNRQYYGVLAQEGAQLAQRDYEQTEQHLQKRHEALLKAEEKIRQDSQLAQQNIPNGKAGDEARKKAERKANEELAKVRISYVNDKITELTKALSDVDAKLLEVDNAASKGQYQAKTDANRARYSALKSKILSDLSEARSLQESAGGVTQHPISTKNDKGPKVQREDPVVRELEQARANLAIAKTQMADLRADANSFDAIREEVAEKIRGKILSGGFNSKQHAYSKELAGVGGDWTKLSEGDPNRKRFDEIVEDEARAKQIAQGKSTLAEANQQLAKAMAAYNDEMARTPFGVNAVSSEVKKLDEQIAAGTKKFAEGSQDQISYIQRMKTIRALQLSSESHSAEIASEETLANLKISLITDVEQRRQAEFDAQMKRLSDKYEAEKKALEDELANEKLVASERARLERGVNDLKRSYENEQETLRLKRQNDERTELEKQKNDWQTYYGQITKMTANWSQSFLDALSTALTGGKFKWKDFLASMLKDVLNLQLKKAFGSQINSMFSSAQDFLLKAFGVNKGAATTSANSSLAGAIGSKIGSWLGTSASTTGSKDATKATDAMGDLATETKKATSSMESMESKGIAGMAQAAVQWITTQITGTAAQTSQSLATDLATSQMVSLTFSAELATQALLSLATNSAGSGIASLIGGIAGAAAGGAAAGAGSSVVGGSTMVALANGGIMSSLGSAPLHLYSNGGVANSPQLALFGEGRKPEAYVPLPDGRSIPVTMKGTIDTTSAGNSPVSIVIQVNHQDGNSKESTSTSGKNDAWSQIANNVKGMVIQEITNQKKPGGVLYK